MENLVTTPLGTMIPKYDVTHARERQKDPVFYYQNGEVKNIYLQDQTEIATPLGKIKVESVTFYEDGSIHRIFPRFGQVSGFWTEEEELALVEPFKGNINGIEFNHKFTCICFYPTGAIKSVTLGKGETVKVETLYGDIETRIGISFYESGKIATLEPNKMTTIETILGTVIAYDNKPIGIHGDSNSLKFSEVGEIISLKTIMTGIEIIDSEHNKKEILPEHMRSQIDIEQFEMVPIKINLEKEKIEVWDSNNNHYSFTIKDYKLRSIYNTLFKTEETCTNCNNCSGCL